ncbi:unnamed protein product [Closterium sp. NIES-53]
MAFEAFIAWLPVAEQESGKKLKSFQSDGGGEYTSQRFKQFLAEKGIKRLVSLPYAHQQQGVAERLNQTLQNTMRKLLRDMRLPNHQWPEAMDHAVMLHNLLSSSSLPNNASPHLLWTGKQGNTKMLRVFGCMVQYRPPSARAGRFSQRAQWGLHLGIEKNYNAWKIFDVHSKETVAARDVIFYERLTLLTYLANLEENRDPTGGFRGDRHFASAADEAEWDEQNVDNASDEAGPLPYCSVPIPMDDENPRESVNAETYFDFADTGYITPAAVNTNEAERVGPNFIPDPEDGDEAAYPEDANLPRYTQSGLQILGLVTAVHGTNTPKEPATVQQALGGEHKEKWREAMDRELKALEERNTWKFVPISVARNKTILTRKWVFRVKTKADGTIDKFKARWVVHGFDQEHGRDFTETFAPVSRHTSLRILLAVAAMKKKKLRQIDVANAFLYAPVDAEIYVELPHGSYGEPNQVCQLLKSLYGIKQAPRLWQQYLHARLIRIGFKQLPHDQGMYRLSKDDDYIILIVYVDDLLYIGSIDSVATWFEGELEKDLSLTVSSTVRQYLGLNIEEGENAIYLNAAKYADTIAKRFALTPTTISTPYRYTAGNDKGSSILLKSAGIRSYQRKLGFLLFAAVTCRPDLSYSASQLATYLKRPEIEHLAELDRALHYFVSTPTIGLTYYKNATTPTELVGYATSLGACKPASTGAAPVEALNTFTLDLGASHCFFRGCTTVTPLTTPVPINLADPSGGPVVARASTILPCPAAPSGSLTGLHLTLFTTNLVSNTFLQDQLVTATTTGGELVAICTDSRTSTHLATFTQRPGSGLYTLTTESAQVAASGQLAVSCSCRLPMHPSLLWHHHLGHPSLPHLHGMHSRLLDLQILRLHSDRGGEFSSRLLEEFCRVEGITQSFTLPASPQRNGIAERLASSIMKVARTSMIHAAAPQFMWPFAVRYAAHQLNLSPRISVPETSPTLRWTGEVGDASAFWDWGSLALVRDTTAGKLSSRTVR